MILMSCLPPARSKNQLRYQLERAVKPTFYYPFDQWLGFGKFSLNLRL
jgi:hypothetical protein